ncbi:MAG: hypothetical protein ACI9IN_000766 [Porticoccaceae bacterium]|jgi:hypothetical protein
MPDPRQKLQEKPLSVVNNMHYDCLSFNPEVA